jgi:hypothetical protein
MTFPSTGPFTRPIAAVSSALAAVPAWQTWLGNGVTPASRIYQVEEPSAGAADKFALVDLSTQWSEDTTDQAPGSAGTVTAGVAIAFRWFMPFGTAADAAAATFYGMLDAVVPALRLALADATRSAVSIALAAGPTCGETEDREGVNVYDVIFTISATEWP